MQSCLFVTLPDGKPNAQTNIAQTLMCRPSVLRRLLFDVGVDTVVLYVGYENNAQKVYHRVGFVGLCGSERVEGVEDALELGFARTARGHW